MYDATLQGTDTSLHIFLSFQMAAVATESKRTRKPIVSEAYGVITKLATELKIDATVVPKGLWERKIDDNWHISLNITADTLKSRGVFTVMPFHALIRYNGMSIGHIHAYSGNGMVANEPLFIKAVEAAISRNNVSVWFDSLKASSSSDFVH
jgi:hypothetical protein